MGRSSTVELPAYIREDEGSNFFVPTTYLPRAGKESGFRMAITGLPIHPSVVWAEVLQVSQLAIPFVGDTT